MATKEQITEQGIRDTVNDVMINDYFAKELEEARKAPSPYVPKNVVLFKQGLFSADSDSTEQQRAVKAIAPILIDQLSAVKNITSSEVEAAAKKTFEWAAKNSGQVNETMEKTKGIVDRITKTHTNEIRATISLQIQDVRKEHFAEQKKSVH
jgi:hypothetical protein